MDTLIAELVEALENLINHEGLEVFIYLDKGIGVATKSGQRWMNAREALLKAKEWQ